MGLYLVQGRGPAISCRTKGVRTCSRVAARRWPFDVLLTGHLISGHHLDLGSTPCIATEACDPSQFGSDRCLREKKPINQAPIHPTVNPNSVPACPSASG